MPSKKAKERKYARKIKAAEVKRYKLMYTMNMLIKRR